MAVMNPLGSRNIIIIDDNYIGEYSQAYMEVGKQIDDIIIKYIGILKGIIDDGSMKGLTAEKLYSFADTASMLLFKTAGVLCDNTWILGNVTRIPRHELPQTLDFSDFLPLFT